MSGVNRLVKADLAKAKKGGQASEQALSPEALKKKGTKK
jgi:hypothetical protein